jgi:hypothetical protein
LQKSPIRPQSKDAGKVDLPGQAFKASANAPQAVALDEREEAGAMAVDEAAEDEGEGPEEVIAGDDAAKEEEEARVPRTKKPPVGMTAAEWQRHCLTHLPYNPACRCCVAGRKRDDPHRRRSMGLADLYTEGKESICADYFFPKDAPGKEGVTAIALCDHLTGWLAGHVVSSKGSGTQDGVEQVLRDLRRMGHHGKIVVKTDQESAIIDLLRAVAKERGEARTVFETAARSDSKGNGEAEKAVQSIEEMLRTLMVDLEERCGEPLSVTEPFSSGLLSMRATC